MLEIVFQREDTRDIDAHRTRRTVSAPAAEIARKPGADGFACGQLLRCKRAVLLRRSCVLLYLFQRGHSGDGQRTGLVLQDVPHGQRTVGDVAARQRLHRNDPHVLRGRTLHQRFTLAFNDIIWEHDGLDLRIGEQPLEAVHRVSCCAEMSDLARPDGVLNGSHGALSRKRQLKISIRLYIVQLIQVDIIRPQVAQADADVPRHVRVTAGHGFRCKNELLPQTAGQCLAQIALRHSVAARGVDVVHTLFHKAFHQCAGSPFVDALDGNAPKPHSRYLQTCLSQNSVLHNAVSSFCRLPQARRCLSTPIIHPRRFVAKFFL